MRNVKELVMTPFTLKTHRCIAAIILALVCLAITPSTAVAGPDVATTARCAKACRECAKACDACYKHCSAMVKAGNKEHAKSARISEDCGLICVVTAKICEHNGPMSAAICEACLKACTACGTECGKSPGMAEMAACTVACEKCAAACKTVK